MNPALPSLKSKTDELATVLRALGFLRSAVIKRRVEVWEQTTHLAITERREEVRVALADLESLVVEQETEVEALRAELHYLELALTHGES